MSDKFKVTADRNLLIPKDGGTGRKIVNAGEPFMVTEEFGKQLLSNGIELEEIFDEVEDPGEDETIDVEKTDLCQLPGEDIAPEPGPEAKKYVVPEPPKPKKKTRAKAKPKKR